MGNHDYCIFYIVRHGETIWNTEHRVQGHTDNPLTLKGKAQAEVLARVLKNIHFDVAYSSDFLRAKQTAEIIARKKHIKVQTTKLLRERNMGIFEGKHLNTPLLYKELAKWFSERIDSKRFEVAVENDDEIIMRLFIFLKYVSVSHKNKTVLIVSHASLIKALLVHLGFAQHEQLGHGAVKNTAYIKLQSDGINFFIAETQGILK